MCIRDRCYICAIYRKYKKIAENTARGGLILTMESMIRDIALAPSGKQKISWVKEHMPLLNILNEKYSKNQIFNGLNMVVTIHLEAKTAYLAQVLKNAGANVVVTGSNPLSTQDDVAAALADSGVTVFATHNCCLLYTSRCV